MAESINRLVGQQELPSSSKLLNIFINQAIRKWQRVVRRGIKINYGYFLSILLFPDGQVFIAPKKDDH